VTVGRAGSSSA